MFKNGKLFGKINVIDLLVILVIIAAIAAAAVFVFFKPQQHMDKLVMKYFIEEVDDFVADKVKVGDALFDDSYMVELGSVTEIERDTSRSFGGIIDNTYSLVSKEGYCSMIITGEVEGKKTDLGCEIAGKKYGVGHTFVLRAGDAKLYLRVYDIQLAEEYEKQMQQEQTTEDESVLVLQYYAEEVDDFIAEKVAEGDLLHDDTYSVDLGKVIGVETAASASYGGLEDNVYTLAHKEGYSSVLITGEVTGTKTGLGATIGGKKYGVGQGFTMQAGDAKLHMRVKNIMTKEDYEEQYAEEQTDTSETSYVTVEFYTPEIEDYFLNMIEVGDTVTDSLRHQPIGTVTAVESAPSVVYTDYQGEYYKTSREDYSSATVVCKVKGEKTDGGVIIADRLRGISEWVDLRIDDLRISLRVNKIG